MRIDVITIFPELVAAVLHSGIPARAVAKGLLQVEMTNPRDFCPDPHRAVDDRPYGGGPGMVMKPQPLADALASIRGKSPTNPWVVYLSPQGRRLDQQGVETLAHRDHLVLIAGRYEGIDERFIEAHVDAECSLGDYVLSGGELGAMVVIDAVARLQPGALGHADSAAEDSFSNGLLDCPHYTRPERWAQRDVPEVLLGGHHALIRRWRLKQSLGRTWLRRPDLLQERALNTEEQDLLTEFQHEHGPGGCTRPTRSHDRHHGAQS